MERSVSNWNTPDFAPSPAGPPSGHFDKSGKIRPKFWPDLAGFKHVDYLQLKVMKLFLAFHHLSDLTV